MSVKKAPEQMNLFEKILEIQNGVDVLQKNKKGYGYTYVTEDVILAHITGKLQKLRLNFFPKMCPSEAIVEPYTYQKTKFDQKTKTTYEENVNEITVKCPMIYEWVNVDNPLERYEVPWLCVGQQSDASQALGSGLSYCSRYFLLKFFKVSTTEDDPDNWRSQRQEEEDRQNKLIVDSIVAEIDEIIKSVTNDKNKTEIATFIKSVAKDKNGKATANYLSITNLDNASAVLTAVKNKFQEEKARKSTEG